MRRALAAIVLTLGAGLVMSPSALATTYECTGPTGPIVVQNVVVPEGAECILEGTQVRGDVLAKPNAAFLLIGPGTSIRGDVRVRENAPTAAFEAEIRGSYRCERCLLHDLTAAKVGKHVTILGLQEGSFINDSTIGGNLTILDSEVADFAFVVSETTVGGNVLFAGNDGPTAIEDNTIAGSLLVLGNDVAGSCGEPFCQGGPTLENGRILGNSVGQSMLVAGNDGPTTITGNDVRLTLACLDNDPPPVGGGNTARHKVGQCRAL
jgi:hypothetical protein